MAKQRIVYVKHSETYYIETPIGIWKDRLDTAKEQNKNKAKPVWPLPVGHCIFRHPEEYGAEIIGW